MKIIAVVLIVGGLFVTMQESIILALIYIGLGIFLLRKYKHQGWLPKGNNLEKQQKKELKRLEKSKVIELSKQKAYRKFNVSGVTYENRQQLLDIIVQRHSSEGVGRIEFIPEPDNKFDPNAVKIIFEDVGHIGYVPKERAVEIDKLLDGNTYDIKWNVTYMSSNDDDDDVAYMEIRLYKQK